ncbi:MAG: hypothetical protein HOP95_00995 [Sphingomonas sp.]|nr:hypothetical protein [Sphingomonas sp.]
MFIDSPPLAPILARVIRLLISMLCALGLALSAVATADATAAPSSGMPACTMDGKIPAKQSKGGKMDCCTPACQAASSSALLPSRDAAEPTSTARSPILASAPVKELASIKTSGLDPPPRA